MVDDKPKPRGKAPCGKDGQPCSWDFRHGCWLEIDGSQHVQRTHADVLKAEAGRKRMRLQTATICMQKSAEKGGFLAESRAPPTKTTRIG